ncbi:MAG: hypothetical protein JSV89_15970 [Spirochaetaceae bacterium]|nr:MAG: hypothetical protein JSV89_15970 [Spirochaetaceae bacterium]
MITAYEFSFIILVFSVAFVFFGLIPGIGAFFVRSRWRLFRRRIQESSLYPFLRYSDLSRRGDFLGRYRVFGHLEAIQGENRIWINDGSFTVEADLSSAKLYFLPSSSTSSRILPVERLQEEFPDEQPSLVSWNQIFSLPAGTQMLIAGGLYSQEDRAVFRSQSKDPLLVVLYDGERNTIVRRAVWGGRQKNEYWNQFTLASLLTGSFCMLLLAYIFMRATPSNLPVLFALSLAFFPISGLLPPGFILYYLYRHFWKRARLLRAQRDLLRLPLRYYPESEGMKAEKAASLPTGESYLCSQEADLLIKGELIIRTAAIPGNIDEVFLFGTYVENEKGRWMQTPRDPMAELVLVMGDPLVLANSCNRRARMFAALSALGVFSALTLNLFLLLLAWHLIIR